MAARKRVKQNRHPEGRKSNPREANKNSSREVSNRPLEGPQLSPGGSKIDSQRPLGSCWRLFGVQVEFGTNFGAIWRPNLGPCWGQVGTKIASTFEHKSDTCLDRNFQPCWTDFRPKLAPFLNDFRIDFTPPCKDAETANIAFSSRGKQQQKATTSTCSETY